MSDTSPTVEPKTQAPQPNFSGASHFCQSVVKYYSSADSGALPIGELQADDQIKAVELDLGENFEFGLFETEDGERIFVKESEISPLVSLFRIKPVKKLDRVYFERFPDFKSAGFNLPFFLGDEYIVKLDSGMKSKQSVMERIEDFKLLGAKEIVDYFGKELEDADLLALPDMFGVISRIEILTPVRKGASHEVLVGIKAKYLDAIPDRSIRYITDFYKSVLSTNFKCREFSNIISNLSSILKKYHSNIGKFSGSLEGINLEKLSEKASAFFNKVKAMMKENGYVLENLNVDSNMEFGFDPETFELLYLLVYDGTSAGKFLNVGINKLSLSTDFKVSKLILQAKNIIRSQSANLSWQDFLSSNFAGEYSIYFGKVQENLGLNLPISDLEDKFEQYKIRFEDPFKTPRDAIELSTLLESEDFRNITSQILAKARNQIGDNFLLNLSDIVANIDDLDSLYRLVFDRISIKDLSSLLLEKASEELGVKDINEIIARAVMKKMEVSDLVDTFFDSFSEVTLKELLAEICSNYDFKQEEVEMVLNSFDTNLYNHILHYDNENILDGMLVQSLPQQGRELLQQKMNEMGMTSCAELFLSIKFRDVFDSQSAQEVICKILQGEVPAFENPCSGALAGIGFQSLRQDIRQSLKLLEVGKLRVGIDSWLKKSFSDNPNFFNQVLLPISKFRVEFDKESKTRGKLLKRNTGVGIDLEVNKKDKGFSLPSLSDVNPKFDFTEYLLGGVDDIFSSAIDTIEDTIRTGIESSLVSSFKSLLTSLLDSLKGGLDLSVPDYGGENIKELFDSSNGMGYDLALEALKSIFDGKLESIKSSSSLNQQSSYTRVSQEDSRFLPVRQIGDISESIQELGEDIGVLDPSDILGMSVSKKDISDFLMQLSDGLKPKEVFGFLRGNVDETDYVKFRGIIQDPKMKALVDEEVLKGVSDMCADLVDQDLIDEVESYYDNREPIGVLCENLGLNYGLSPYPNVKTLAEELAENYQGLSDDDIKDIMEDLLEEIKDSVSDAIGKSGASDLPFGKDPDSFMPPPSEIAAMDYANDVVLDAIFDPIKKEYKREAATYADNLFVLSDSEEYVQMYREYGDALITGLDEDTFEPIKEAVTDNYKYNTEFENFYKTSDTKLYYKNPDGKYIAYNTPPAIKIVTDISDEEQTGYGENRYYYDGDDRQNIYVRKDSTALEPPYRVQGRISTSASRFRFGSANTMFREENPHFRIELAGGDFKTKYDTESSSLTFREDDCQDETEVNTSLAQYPPHRFRGLTYNYISQTGLLGQMYLEEIMPYIQDIYIDINLYVAKKLFSVYENSGLFDKQKLYTLIIDSDDIDLMKFEQIKSEVKSDYNRNFSYNQEDSQMSSSSLNGLIKTKLKIYTLELLMRSCFLLDMFLQVTEMPDGFPQRVLDAIKKDYGNNQEYVKIYEDLNSIDRIVEESYNEIMNNLGLVFEDSIQGVVKLFDSSEVQLISVANAREPVAVTAMKAFQSGVELIAIPYSKNQQGIEVFNPLSQDIRLCYLNQYYEVEGWANSPFYEAINTDLSELNLAGTDLSGNPISTFYKRVGTVSQIYLFPTFNPATQNALSVVPLLEVNNGNIGLLLKRFFDNYTLLPGINDLLMAEVSTMVAKECPQILTAFGSTKDTIKSTIESVKNSEKTFDNDDKQLEIQISNYSQESGTNPEYSNVARKMALQTVPLILKGMAEKFDTNTQIGARFRTVADLAGVYIPPQIASLMAFGFSNFTIPPNPIGLMYLATGFLEPKERKRIKEMLNNRNTREGIAVGTSETFLEQVESANEETRQQLFSRDIGVLTGVIEDFIDRFKRYANATTENISEWEREDGFVDYQLENKFAVRVPQVDTDIYDTAVVVDGFRERALLFYIQMGASLSDRLEFIVQTYEDILDSFAFVAEDMILGANHTYEFEAFGAPNQKSTSREIGFTDDDIEREILVQDEFVKTRAFAEESLKYLFWIGEGFNMIAICHSNMDNDLDFELEQENSAVNIESSYNPRLDLSVDQVISRYNSLKQHPNIKQHYEDVLSGAYGWRNKFYKWANRGLIYPDLSGIDNGAQRSDQIYKNILNHIREYVIPFLRENGY